MDFISQMKQNMGGLLGGATTTSSSAAADGGSTGIGKMLLYAAVIAVFVVAGYWAYTNYIAPMLGTNLALKQGSSKVDGGNGEDDEAYDMSAGSMNVKFEDAPIAELYLFKTDWCPHCKRAQPIFETMKKEYESKLVNGYRILFKVVDCEQEPSLADKFKIDGYPTIKLVKDDQVIEYDAKPDREHLIQFLTTVLE
jgi:thiol-disulfide isomerase/thioredoxin